MEAITNIFTPILTLILGSGATWIFTIKYDRKQAEASAMEKLQTVYQRMIADLNDDRTRLESEIGKIKEELHRLENRFSERERVMRIARTHCCALAETCQEFKLLDLTKYEK